MTRTYSLTDNPFMYGLKHATFELADKHCGLLTEIELTKDEKGNNRLKVIRMDTKNYIPLNSLEKTVFYAGRSIRFVLSIPGTIVDFILQFFQSLAFTVEILSIKGEMSIRKCQKIDDTSINRFFKTYISPSVVLIKIRKCISFDEPTWLANDLGLVPNYTNARSFAVKYRTFLMCNLFSG